MRNCETEKNFSEIEDDPDKEGRAVASLMIFVMVTMGLFLTKIGVDLLVR